MVANKLLKSKAIYLGILYIYNVKWDFLSNEFCIVLKKKTKPYEKKTVLKSVCETVKIKLKKKKMRNKIVVAATAW